MNEQKYDPLAIKLGQHEWMTLRDYFAAQALSKLVGGWAYFSEGHKDYADSLKHYKDVSKLAYSYADAMLEARKQ